MDGLSFLFFMLVNIVIFIVTLAIYLAPAIVALVRDVEHKWLIAAGNLLFGWTAVGWVICLVFAIKGRDV